MNLNVPRVDAAKNRSDSSTRQISLRISAFDNFGETLYWGSKASRAGVGTSVQFVSISNVISGLASRRTLIASAIPARCNSGSPTRENDIVAGKAQNDLGDFLHMELDLDIRLQRLAKV